MKDIIRRQAVALGFDVFGVSGVDAPVRRDYFEKWLADGKNGSMEWLARNNEKRLYPAELFPGARSIVVVGVNYFQPYPEKNYKIARYALGADYHNFLFKRLKKLCATMRELGGEQRPCVDTAPVSEKSIGAHSGIGWQGKHTVLINRTHGTWLLLGLVFTTLELEPDLPEPARCGSCRRCAANCPTGAITAPYALDARRCLAYLSIEHEGAIPPEFRVAMHDRVFGCDACLEVCPWNRRAQATREAKFSPKPLPENLRDTLSWTTAAFDEVFAGTPIKRLRLDRWARNVCVVLGNTGNADDLPALQKVAGCENALLAEHAAWAIARIKLKSK